MFFHSWRKDSGWKTHWSQFILLHSDSVCHHLTEHYQTRCRTSEQNPDLKTGRCLQTRPAGWLSVCMSVFHWLYQSFISASRGFSSMSIWMLYKKEERQNYSCVYARARVHTWAYVSVFIPTSATHTPIPVSPSDNLKRWEQNFML